MTKNFAYEDVCNNLNAVLRMALFWHFKVNKYGRNVRWVNCKIPSKMYANAYVITQMMFFRLAMF